MTLKTILLGAAALTPCLLFVACEKKMDPSAGAPPEKIQVVPAGDMSLISVDKPDLFALVSAQTVDTHDQLNATGTVNPDISAEQPVISLANGRVVEILARIGDVVHKGQLLLKVQSPDATNAFDTYIKANADEILARKTLVRDKALFDHGAIPQSTLEAAQDTEDNAKADLTAAEEQLKTLGIDKDHPSSIVSVRSPISGVIVAQNVTNAAATGISYAGNTSAFTVADISHVWVICDVFENDIHKLALGQEAKISVEAYPGKPLSGRISEIDAVLDPTLRTAKVRIQVANPGFLKLGMFVHATFAGRDSQSHVAVPSSAILQLHDRSSVFVPGEKGTFRRITVTTGQTLDDGRIVVLSGIASGQRVVANALALQNTADQQ